MAGNKGRYVFEVEIFLVDNDKWNHLPFAAVPHSDKLRRYMFVTMGLWQRAAAGRVVRNCTVTHWPG